MMKQCSVKKEGGRNNETHTHTPVDDSSVIDRVVDINRMSRQAHLFSRWSVV